MAGIYVISDTHFNHEKILKYCNRQFYSVEEMNETMIDNWNSVVRKNDTIFHLGDFAFGDEENVKELLDRLNGRKVLILGNHDRKLTNNTQRWYDMNWDEVYKYPILYKKFFWLSHEPIRHLTDDMPFVSIHGHIHNNEPQSKHHVNVSVERIGYKPVNLDLIINEFREKMFG